MASIPSGLAALTPPPRELVDHGTRLSVSGISVEHCAPGFAAAAATLTGAAAAMPAGGSAAMPAGGSAAADGRPRDTACDPASGGPGADAPTLAVSLAPDPTLPPEGYRIDVTPGAPRAAVTAADPAGALHAARLLLAAIGAVSGADGLVVPAVTVRDWPQLRLRGTVEGYYGPPWTHEQRLAHLHFSARHRLNVYAYAPKDDAFHRARWREPYPDDELARIAELAAVAERLGVRFVHALAPGLSMRYSDSTEQQLLHEKAEQLWHAGVRHFALLFDDIPPAPAWADDVAAFGAGPAGLGAAHGAVCSRFADGFLGRHGAGGPLLICPAEYDGTQRSAYRDRLAATLPADALIWWSGPSVVSPTVTRPEIDAAAASYGRRLVLWDNVPVNDFERAQVYLGPPRERAAQLGGSALDGLLANPMIEALPSRLTLACAAEYAWDPAGFDPDAALARALRAVAGSAAGALAPLARACSTWPPDAAADPAVLDLTAAALGPDPAAALDAAARLDGLLEPLERYASERPDGALARALDPWLAAAAAIGAAGRRAIGVLRAGLGDDSTDLAALGAIARAALDAAEQHPPDVLRRAVSPFARAVLQRFAAPADTDPRTGTGSGSGRGRVRNPRTAPGTGTSAAAGAPTALLLGEGVPGAGEERLVRLLRAAGLAVARRPMPDPDADPPALVVIARSAAPAAAAATRALPVPVLALAHLEPAALAERAGVLLRERHVRIVAPGHPLAAGRTGPVAVHRWPGMSRWGVPGPDATIVARAEEEPHPVIFSYAAGDRLADGGRAAARRVAMFPGRDLLAPWLATPDADALVTAAVVELLRGAPG